MVEKKEKGEILKVLLLFHSLIKSDEKSSNGIRNVSRREQSTLLTVSESSIKNNT